MSQAQPTPGGAAEDGGTDAGMARLWLCPHCNSPVGYLDDSHNLVVFAWRGCVTLESGNYQCSCGAIIQWHRSKQLPF